MCQRNGDFQLKRAIVYSILAHLAMVVLVSISVPASQENNLLLMDVQIAGEVEQQESDQIIPQEIVPQEPQILEKEEKSPEEIHKEQVKEDSAIVQEKKTADPIEENIEKPDEPSSNESPTKVEPETSKKEPQETPQVEEEPVPKLNNEENKPKEKIRPPKPKRRDRKALMETIKNAEKKMTKEKNRKKILEIAEKASMKRKDDAFNKMLDGSISNLRRNSSQGLRSGLGNGDSSVAHIINEQIRPYWNVPSGIKDAEKLVIEVELVFNDIGEVIPSSIKIVDEKRYAMDYIFKAAADSARRAILEVGRFRIPRHKLEKEKEYRFKFNVADALSRSGG